MSWIELVDLSCARGGVPIYSGLSAQIEETMRLTGPNGCGKSSLLKVMAGRVPSSHGTVMYDGRSLQPEDILFLDHKPLIKSVLTVQENLRFWAEIYGTILALSDACEALGLEKLWHTPVNILSSGQKKRVQLALLYLKPVKVWLLDEPLLSLDSAYIKRLGDIVAGHVKAEGILVYASHDPLPGIKDNTLNLANFHKDQYDFANAA